MSAVTGRQREAYRDRLLFVLVVALALSTVVGVVAPVVGVGHRRTVATQRDGFALWSGLVWLVLVCAVFLRSRAHIRRLSSRATATDDRLADLAATTHEWMWESDARLVMVSCGSAVARLLGHPPGELIGRSMFEFMEPSDIPRARAVITAALEAGSGWTDLTAGWRHAEGHRVVMTGSAVPVHNARGEITGYRGTRGLSAPEAPTEATLAAAAHHVQEIIDASALQVALQPVVELTTGRWTSVEALARFDDRTPPAVAFAQADEAGLGVDLELLALHTALEAVDCLPEAVSLSVNASPACIVDPRFRCELEQADLDLDRVIVEITEHSAVACYEDINGVLAPLRDRGLRTAVDDAGAGYASFRHVLALRPNVIKLDRSLITEIDTDQARRSFVTAIMLMALDLGATVTAEGIERPEELQVLAALGVDHAQGFLICPPQLGSDRWATWPDARWTRPLAVNH